MGFITGLIEAVFTFGALALILVLVPALIMIVFSLGSMMDRRTNNQ